MLLWLKSLFFGIFVFFTPTIYAQLEPSNEVNTNEENSSEPAEEDEPSNEQNEAEDSPASSEISTETTSAHHDEETGTISTEEDPSSLEAEELPRAIVIDAAPYGIDPVVGQHVTTRIRMVAAEMGYQVLDGEATLEAARRMRMPFPPSPADLWRVTFVAQAKRGVFAKVWAHQGQYIVEISVASLDGTGPFFARGSTSAETLHQVVTDLTRQALPLAEIWNEEAAEQLIVQSRSTESSASAEVPTRPNQSPRLRRSRPDRRPTRRFDLALQLEGAIGTSSDHFFNFLAGARLGVRITKTLMLGLHVGYANLRGRENRANNILPMLQIENRIRLSARTDLTVPLRFGIGYLPFNGPVIRLAAGLNLPLSPRVELHFDILSPTFWVLPDRTTSSLNLAAEVIFRL